MKYVLYLGFVVALSVLLALPRALIFAQEGALPQAAGPLGSAFTYQGYLSQGGGPANGAYDFMFTLFDEADAGIQMGSVSLNNVPVSGGYFTVLLDYGYDVFQGEGRWLEVRVRASAGGGSFSVLSPRQALTSSPYALYARSAPWSGLIGMPEWAAGGYSAGSGLVLDGTTFRVDTAYTDGRYWKLGGNSLSETGILGTTSNHALEIMVNNSRVLRLEPHETSPNIIGGHSGNWVTSGVYGATIFGGGEDEWGAHLNRVTDDYGTVAGGANNQAGDGGDTTDGRPYATVGGGYSNMASGRYSTVSGGWDNQASGSFWGFTTVSGGYSNQAMMDYSTIGGGRYNQASGYYWGDSTVGGGSYNQASGDRSTISGGWYNQASGGGSTVGGGRSNQASGTYSTVGGGISNQASGDEATIGGGEGNQASGTYSTIGGGSWNQASGTKSTVSGGEDNHASGLRSTVPGGYENQASGDYSFAAGRRAKANNQGCFVWGDSFEPDVTCSVDNRWVARASGGVYFYTNSSLTSGVYVPAGGGSWSSVSDRNLKENLHPVDGRDILGRVTQLPITTWNYLSQDASIRHIGPMAQDFYAVFELGEDDVSIATVDLDGVALGAIQGLAEIAEEQEALITQQDIRIAELEMRLSALEARLEGGNSPASSFGGWGLVGLLLAGMAVVSVRKHDRREQP